MKKWCRELNIIHGIMKLTSDMIPIYRNTNKPIEIIPKKLINFLYEKYEKFFLALAVTDRLLEFTFGYDKDTGISAVAIVHPKDYFSRKIGRKIVEGRILRQKGELLFYDSKGIVHRAPYSEEELENIPYLEIS